MNSPFNTPSRGNHQFGSSRASSMRRNAMNNHARNNHQNGTPTSKPLSGPSLPTESGAATGDESLFGPAVPRKLTFNSVEGQQSQRGPRNEFRHENAIYIRYIDPSITTEKMMAILNKNATIEETIKTNPDVIEVTRLVKKRATEDEIAKRRNGVSYRIGCSPELLPLINDKSIWASHWEIRLWDKDFGENEHGHKLNSNFRGAPSAHRPMG